MDLELARTFLTIVHSGSFVSAANQLHLTQTAVTARIKNLESQLDCTLFIRNRAGAKLTGEGERFVDFAQKIIQTWENAKREVPSPDCDPNLLTLGSEVTLSNPLLLQWVRLIRQTWPSLKIRVEVGDSAALQQQVLQGRMDAVLVYRPFYCEGLQVEHILEEKLIQIEAVNNSEPYIFVDWGMAFRKEHNAVFTELDDPELSFNLGPLAFQYLARYGGRGYFRTRIAQRALRKGVIRAVPNAPEFSYPIFLVYARNTTSQALEPTVPLLRRIAAGEPDWTEHWEFSP